jgi:putative CRISPR-associated protein (TIGR02619 family)
MRNTLICTVGTSLFKPNLLGLPNPDTYDSWLAKQPQQDRQYLSFELTESLKTALANRDWKLLAELLGSIPGTTRICGAEINSITDLIGRGYCADKCSLVFCHSATPDGQQIAEILQHYYKAKGHRTEAQEIEYLQDAQPKLFRTKGLRNLAKIISQVVRNYNAQFCAINATGGYKAQIAIGVLMGQALGVPVYYKHELFSEIIAFPPMPISLDFSLWLEKSGWLTALDRKEMVAWQQIEEDWDERMEALVERIEIDGKQYLELSPTGQIFHETFKNRFESNHDTILPPPVQQKQQPRLSNHDWGNARQSILNYLQRITDECAYVQACRTLYWNPDLPSPLLFRLKGDDIEGIFSNGTWTVKFIVETSATTVGQRAACVADLNSLTENW